MCRRERVCRQTLADSCISLEKQSSQVPSSPSGRGLREEGIGGIECAEWAESRGESVFEGVNCAIDRGSIAVMSDHMIRVDRGVAHTHAMYDIGTTTFGAGGNQGISTLSNFSKSLTFPHNTPYRTILYSILAIPPLYSTLIMSSNDTNRFQNVGAVPDDERCFLGSLGKFVTSRVRILSILLFRPDGQYPTNLKVLLSVQFCSLEALRDVACGPQGGKRVRNTGFRNIHSWIIILRAVFGETLFSLPSL